MDPIIIVYVVLFGAMYLFMVVPKQRQQKAHKAMLNTLAEGDEVVLDSGVYGFVSSVDDNVIWIEVAENVEIKVSRSSVSGVVVDSDQDNDEDES